MELPSFFGSVNRLPPSRCILRATGTLDNAARSIKMSPMASTGLVQDERFQLHRTGQGHPERPERLVAIARKLAATGIAKRCTPIAVSPVDLDLVRLVHSEEYLQRVRSACAAGDPYIDVADSAICPESWDIARLACGAVVNAVEEVFSGRLSNAFCAVRPPGHHAEHDHSLGFCLINNIAVAAMYLVERKGLSRVLILDWDVHHGNGTQHTFERDPRVLFISLHGHPGIVYPGTGHARERGFDAGEGFTVNVPILPPGKEPVWRAAFDETVRPIVDQFQPQFILISAGFDAHRRDPLAPLELETESYGWLTDELLAMARKHCAGKLVSILEGGYDLAALADSVALHIERLLVA